MKGDFSRWDPTTGPNLDGVLHQQGRVLLDRDWNDGTRLTLERQDQTARDVIGAGVVAVPAGAPQALRVEQAQVVGGEVHLLVQPGSAWVDGLHVTLPGPDNTPQDRLADYLTPPIQDPAGQAADLAAGLRDAVVLETWRETLNAFQAPDELIEPALGGPDTTERLYTGLRFRLYRMAANDTCLNLGPRLQDDPARLGRLRATLAPATVIPGDCPTVEGGGYTGFEHQLYRVEIASTDDPNPFFKWSQFNGGLVGRGQCDLGGPQKKFQITANDQAIKMAGVSAFYLEVVEQDPARGAWRVTYGAEVTLNDDDLEVSAERYVEAARPTGRVFFRLWNGLLPVGDFLKATAPAEPVELRDGIRLEFDPPGARVYRPGDYWTFSVRAGGLGNPPTLVADTAPHGPLYHRAPLAVLEWNAALQIRYADQQIDDCRDVFQPLTRQGGCCVFRVGDGLTSFGDFNSLEEAVRHLPVVGGEICLLPGQHRANVRIVGRREIKISGCGRRTLVIPRPEQVGQPVFSIEDSQAIQVEDLDVVTFGGSSIVMHGSRPGLLKEIAIRRCRLLACTNAIHALNVSGLVVEQNLIRMLDVEGGDVAIYVLGEDCRIERNDLGLAPGTPERDPNNPDQPPKDQPDPTDPCAEPEVIYRNPKFFTKYLAFAWQLFLPKLEVALQTNPFKTLGGIQIGSGSERVVVLRNRIAGGAGNGITLGSDLQLSDFSPGEDQPQEEDFFIDHRADILWGGVYLDDQPLAGVTVAFTAEDGQQVTAVTAANGTFTTKAGPNRLQVSLVDPRYAIKEIETRTDGELGDFHLIRVVRVQAPVGLADVLAFIYEVQIEHNEIANMGLSGIGVPLLDPAELTRLAEQTARGKLQTDRSFLVIVGALFNRFGIVNGFVVNLDIHDNFIHHCWQNVLDDRLRQELPRRGFGGVSLGLCEDLRLRENRIEANGREHVRPTCGVFVLFVDQADISHNWIVNNGPVDPAAAGLPQAAGRRGGLVIRMAATFSGVEQAAPATPAGVAAAGQDVVKTKVAAGIGKAAAAASQVKVNLGLLALYRQLLNRQAARLVDNLVEQPVGRALTLLGLGPVAVLNNQLYTDFAGQDPADVLAGVSLVFVLGSATSSLGKLAYQSARLSSRANLLYNDNQAALGFGQRCLSAQFLVSAGDLGFSDNQSDVRLGQILIVNTFLIAKTVRAIGNRLTEQVLRASG